MMMNKFLFLFLILLTSSCASFGSFDISQPLLKIPEEQIEYEPEKERMSWDIFIPRWTFDRCQMIFWTSFGCPECDQLKNETFSNQEVIKLAKVDFDPIMMVEGDSYFESFGQIHTPTVAFIDKTGFIISKHEGFLKKEEMMAEILSSAENGGCIEEPF